MGESVKLSVEDADGLNQSLRLALQALRSGRALFYQRCVLLGDGIHLADGLAGFQNAVALFTRGGADFGDQGGDLLHLLHDGFDFCLGEVDQCGAVLHLVYAVVEQLPRLH